MAKLDIISVVNGTEVLDPFDARQMARHAALLSDKTPCAVGHQANPRCNGTVQIPPMPTRKLTLVPSQPSIWSADYSGIDQPGR